MIRCKTLSFDYARLSSISIIGTVITALKTYWHSRTEYPTKNPRAPYSFQILAAMDQVEELEENRPSAVYFCAWVFMASRGITTVVLMAPTGRQTHSHNHTLTPINEQRDATVTTFFLGQMNRIN